MIPGAHNLAVSEADDIGPPPSPDVVTQSLRLVEPLRKLINPKVYGIDNVPERRALLVGNHTLLGVLDVPLLCAELADRGRVVRALADNALFKVPGGRKLLTSFGVVRGSRANCAVLMRRGELIMVFPGGGREVTKRKGELYRLVWKNRMGFARMAIQYGYPIVPFAAVGADEAYDILIDGDNPLVAPIRLISEKVLGSPDVLPIVRGVGPTLIPRPERQYHWFGQPIDTTKVKGRQSDDATVRRVREATKAAIEDGIGFLLVEQKNDPNRSVIKRLLGPERR